MCFDILLVPFYKLRYRGIFKKPLSFVYCDNSANIYQSVYYRDIQILFNSCDDFTMKSPMKSRMYTLLVNGIHVTTFQTWPSCWLKPNEFVQRSNMEGQLGHYGDRSTGQNRDSRNDKYESYESIGDDGDDIYTVGG